MSSAEYLLLAQGSAKEMIPETEIVMSVTHKHECENTQKILYFSLLLTIKTKIKQKIGNKQRSRTCSRKESKNVLQE